MRARPIVKGGWVVRSRATVRVALAGCLALLGACGLNAQGESNFDAGTSVSIPDATTHVDTGHAGKPDTSAPGKPDCTIDQHTYPSGAANPANPCESCQPGTSTDDLIARMDRQIGALFNGVSAG